MLDPLSALSAPPPRYLLESDSSDEEGQGVYGDSSTRAPKLRTTAPPVRVQWLDGKAAYTSAVVGIGQAGRYLQRRAGARLAALTLEGSAGTGFALPGGGLLLVLEDGECADEVVRVLVSEVDVKSWTVFSSYVPALYIPSSAEGAQPVDPPVRYLAAGSSTPAPPIRSYDAPNYATGIAAAFLSQATHPAAPLPSATLFLLPLPLSRIAPSGPAAALVTLPADVAADFSRAVPWTEADDEPHAGLGMGARRPRADAPAADLGGMYM